MRRLKVKLNKKTGELVLRTTFNDLREIFTAAALHEYEALKFARGDDKRYHEGLLKFLGGIDKLIDMQLRPYLHEDELPLTAKSHRTRKVAVKEKMDERRLIERCVKEAIKTARPKSKKASAPCLTERSTQPSG